MKKKAISTIVKGIQKVAKASAKKKAAAATKKVSSGAKTTAKTKNVRAKTNLLDRREVSRQGFDPAKASASKAKGVTVTKVKKPLTVDQRKANDTAKKAGKAISTNPKVKAVKKAVKKAPAKTAPAKTATKKTATKKVATKKVATKKVATKKVATKKAATKKAAKNKEKALRESQEKFMNSKGRGKAKSKSGKSARQAGYDAGKKAATGKTLKKVKKGAVKVAKSRITQGVGAGYAGAKLGSNSNGGSTNPQASKYFTEAELEAARRRVKASRNR